MIYNVLNEVTIGNCGQNFRIDISDRQVGHCGRLKITARSGSSIKGGTSISLDPSYRTYDEIYKNCIKNSLTESEHLIPLVVGFITIHHDLLYNYSLAITKKDYNTQKELRPIVEEYWKSYYTQFSNANKATIRSYVNMMTGVDPGKGKRRYNI